MSNGWHDREYIQVMGVGTGEAEAEFASFSVRVSLISITREKARESAVQVTNKIIETAEKTYGVESKDITFAGIIASKRGYIKDTEDQTYKYEAAGGVLLKVRNMDKLEEIRTVLEELPFVTLSTVTLGADEETRNRARKSALELAMKNAREKAEILVAGEGLQVGRVAAVESLSSYASRGPSAVGLDMMLSDSVSSTRSAGRSSESLRMDSNLDFNEMVTVYFALTGYPE